MRQTIFILFVLYLPMGNAATLQVENQSRFIAVIIDYTAGYPCVPDKDNLKPCLIAPLATTTYELSNTENLSAVLRFVSLPEPSDKTLDALKKHTFKSVGDFTYQPIGPLKYEQVRCETPIDEGISIQIILVGLMDMTCEKGTDRRLSWVYKRNDVHLKFILKDLPAKQSKPDANPL